MNLKVFQDIILFDNSKLLNSRLKMTKNKIILFDLDGTLIDSTEAVYEGFCEAFKHHNKEIPHKESVSTLIGHTLEDMFHSLGIPKNECKKYINIYKEHYRKICNKKTTLLKNAKESILKADEFAYLGIVTTKTGLYSKALLEHFNVLQYFQCVIGRENVTYAKPDKEPILKALESFPKNIAKQDIFMIGDTPLDILAADNAEIKSFGVLSGYSSLELLQKYTNNLAKDSLDAVCKIQHL